jgi:hypothetical protein
MQLIGESDNKKRGQISFALWAAFDHSTWSSGALSAISGLNLAAANSYLTAAKQAVGSMSLGDFSNVAIYSPLEVIGCPDAAHPCLTTPPQEMLVVRASETSAAVIAALNAFAVIGLCVWQRRRRRCVSA